MFNKMYLLIMASAMLAISYWCFASNDADSLGWPIFFIAATPAILVLHLFLKRNKRSISSITKYPSQKNVEVFNELLLGKEKAKK